MRVINEHECKSLAAQSYNDVRRWLYKKWYWTRNTELSTRGGIWCFMEKMRMWHLELNIARIVESC